MTSRCLILLLTLLATMLHAQTDAPPPTRPEKRVFAHYMVCFGSSVEFYMQEIELAQRQGIDGWALNCGQWLLGPDKPGNYVTWATTIYEAARRLDSGFQLFFSIDCSGIRDMERDMVDMVERFADHPNQLYHDGKQVISTYAGRPESFAKVLPLLAERGHPVCFVPNYSHPRYSANHSFASALRALQRGEPVAGYFWFNPDATVAEILRGNAILRQATLFLDQLYMAGVSPSYNSPNLRDHYGVEGYGAIWEGFTRDGADWVEIVTWNDYNEDSHLMPYRWGSGREKQYHSHDEVMLDATAYYSAWFKQGRPPAIAQDKLTYAYRNRSVWLRQAWDVKAGAWVDLTASGWPFDQIHDDAEDTIYVTTMLTAPATVAVRVGKQVWTREQPAGVAHLRVPLAGGVPRFTLARDGTALLDFLGRKQILDATTITKENSPKGYHLLNRTWTGGDAVGEPVRLTPAGGPVTIAAIGDRVDLAVSGLTTATYAIRVHYTNAEVGEARLTLTADGPPRAANDYPYYMPLPLPPTGDRVAAVSFLWSLYPTTSRLTVAKLENPSFKQTEDDPLRHDHGQATIHAIELVKLEPVVPAAPFDPLRPALVAIPGGRFVMGADANRPDEAPAHEVTLAPFAIGKCEVTNAEYERFAPAHRQVRDGYSWRDREPVIMVSWEDAARYCNWLSEQHGLTPAMTEIEEEVTEGDRTRQVKRWVVDPLAEGFRLPTEAEWEYVASGRGQGRRWPWGATAPRPGFHGNFQLAASLSADPRQTATEAKGVAVVGSYPEGASRDGVLDLAGNVSEWCADTFHPYAAEAVTNPLPLAESNYRVIRGGSWGYYGLSQECVDREFNNPRYPGYVYLGFRVAISDAGYRKLRGE